MKEAHLKNIVERLGRVIDLVDNPDRLSRLIKRVDPELRGNDVKRSTDDLVRLIQQDLPELIDALRAEKIHTRELRAALHAEQVTIDTCHQAHPPGMMST